MRERYDERAAAHYAAYRPRLHQIILGRVLSTGERFGVGLDVGCGTGYSARALAEHCYRVYAIDPSESMLSRATADPKVTYLRAAGDRVPLAGGSIDLVTFAGSLFYADSDATRAEIRRVCRSGIVAVYDFEVLLSEVLKQCGVDAQAAVSDYDHRANFSGVRGFTELAVGRERIRVDVTPPQLAHVLLSDSDRLDRLARKYGRPDPFPALVDELASQDGHRAIEVDIYYSKYRIAA